MLPSLALIRGRFGNPTAKYLLELLLGLLAVALDVDPVGFMERDGNIERAT